MRDDEPIRIKRMMSPELELYFTMGRDPDKHQQGFKNGIPVCCGINCPDFSQGCKNRCPHGGIIDIGKNKWQLFHL
jgi:hypothetical protein